MLLRRLSQIFGGVKKGWAVDTFQGGFPVHQTMLAVPATSQTSVLSAVTLGTGVTTLVSGGITDPTLPRNLIIKGNAGTVVGSVLFTGKDWAGRTITESIATNGASAVNGSKAFKEVDTILFPARGAASDAISVGVGNKLGLYRPFIATVTGVEALMADGTPEPASAVDLVNNTVTPTTAPNGSVGFQVSYLTDIF